MHFTIDGRTITQHFPGIGRYVFNLLQALPPLLAPGERLTALRTPEANIPTDVRSTLIRSSPFDWRQQWEVPRALRRLQADLYHSTYFVMPYRPGILTVLTVYDLIPLLQPSQVSPRARWLSPLLIRLALRAADHVIAISAATRDALQQHLHVPPERVTVVPLAPDPRFRPQPPESVTRLRERLELPERYVLYLGSNKPHKNLTRLIEAWAQVTSTPEAAGWTLVIAGVWDARYPEPQQRAVALHLAETVRFLGPVAESDLLALYSGAGLFVFPSLHEGFGLPILEAMACGVPVACSRIAPLVEVGGEAIHTFDPRDVTDMANALCTLLGDAARRAALREQALQQARRFTWQQVAQRTLAVYRRVGSAGTGA